MDVADIATDTSSTATPTVVDPAVDGNDADAGAVDIRDSAEATEAPRSANKWADLQDALGRFGEGKLEPLTPPAAEAVTDVGQDDEEGDGTRPKPDAQGKTEQPDKPDASKGEPRFSVIDADGDAMDAEWPEGAKLRFKADGKPVEVTSFDQLVQMAQKAPLADRLSGELGRRTQHFQRELQEREQTITARDQALEESEATILAIAFDDQARARVQEALKDYRSPAAREGLKAQRDLAMREQRDARQAEANREQATTQFWERVRTDIGAQLAQHEYLADEDVDEVLDGFYRGYEQHRNELVERYSAIAASRGIRPEAAVAEAERDALAWLTEQNLAAVMKGLNDRYAARAGRRHGTATRLTPPGTPNPSEADAAAQHNARTSTKLRQQANGRVMRGNNGAPPAGHPAPAQRPRTYEGQMEAAKAELRKAGERRAR
jgi:hypothetical protein